MFSYTFFFILGRRSSLHPDLTCAQQQRGLLLICGSDKALLCFSVSCQCSYVIHSLCPLSGCLSLLQPQKCRTVFGRFFLRYKSFPLLVSELQFPFNIEIVLLFFGMRLLSIVVLFRIVIGVPMEPKNIQYKNL